MAFPHPGLMHYWVHKKLQQIYAIASILSAILFFMRTLWLFLISVIDQKGHELTDKGMLFNGLDWLINMQKLLLISKNDY